MGLGSTKFAIVCSNVFFRLWKGDWGMGKSNWNLDWVLVKNEKVLKLLRISQVWACVMGAKRQPDEEVYLVFNNARTDSCARLYTEVP